MGVYARGGFGWLAMLLYLFVVWWTTSQALFVDGCYEMSTFQMLRLSSFVDSWDKQAVPSADFDTHMIHTFIDVWFICIYIYILTCFAVCIYIYIHLGACHWFSEVTIDRFPFFYSRWSVRIGESSQKMTKTFWFAQMHGNFVSLRQKVQPIVKAKEVKIPCMESMGDGIYWVTKSLAPWHEHFLLLWMISM